MRLLVHASGFKSPFPTEMDEIRCGKPAEIGGRPKCNWSPSTVDLEALGRGSAGSTPAANLRELADIIERQKPGSIDELRILGHSSDTFFALAGTIVTDSDKILVKFEENSMIGQSATFLGLQPRFHKLRDRFAAAGKVTLAGCGSGGTGSLLLDLASRSFLCCVHGFKRPIQYGFNTSFPLNARQIKDKFGKVIGPLIDARFKLKDRGRVSYSSATLAIEEILGSSFLPIEALNTDAWVLQSDAASCVGQAMLNAARRVDRSPIDASLSSFELGWRILNEFFRGRAENIASVGYDANLRGLRVEIKGGSISIVVGKAYVQNTNPTTIDQRVAEMGEALDLVAVNRPGTVLMK